MSGASPPRPLNSVLSLASPLDHAAYTGLGDEHILKQVVSVSRRPGLTRDGRNTECGEHHLTSYYFCAGRAIIARIRGDVRFCCIFATEAKEISLDGSRPGISI
jgi:hypothetical protein